MSKTLKHIKCLLIGVVRSVPVKRALYTFLMDFGLLGGIAAFFDTSGMFYPLTSLTVHSFGWHICLILLGVAAGFTKKRGHHGRGLYPRPTVGLH